jgi:hypothetical protein
MFSVKNNSVYNSRESIQNIKNNNLPQQVRDDYFLSREQFHFYIHGRLKNSSILISDLLLLEINFDKNELIVDVIECHSVSFSTLS